MNPTYMCWEAFAADYPETASLWRMTCDQNGLLDPPTSLHLWKPENFVYTDEVPEPFDEDVLFLARMNVDNTGEQVPEWAYIFGQGWVFEDDLGAELWNLEELKLLSW